MKGTLVMLMASLMLGCGSSLGDSGSCGQTCKGAPSCLAFYTLTPASAYNGESLTGTFSVSALGAPLCLPNTHGACAFVENVRWKTADNELVFGSGYIVGGSVFMQLIVGPGLSPLNGMIFTGSSDAN